MRFCFACGAALPGDPPVQCAGCGRRHYQNPIPTGSTVIIREERVLFIRRSIPPYLGQWDLPGGFCELMETPEQAAVREAREEVGMKVRLTGYLGSYVGEYRMSGESEPRILTNAYFLAEPLDDSEPTLDRENSEWQWLALEEFPEEIAFPDSNGAALADLRRWMKKQQKA